MGSHLRDRLKSLRNWSCEEAREVSLRYALVCGERHELAGGCRLRSAYIRSSLAGWRHRLLHRGDDRSSPRKERRSELTLHALPDTLPSKRTHHLRQTNHYRSGVCDRRAQLVLRHNGTLSRRSTIGAHIQVTRDDDALPEEVPYSGQRSALTEFGLRDREAARTRREVVRRRRAACYRVHAVSLVDPRYYLRDIGLVHC